MDRDKGIISVIVAVYNVEKYLPRCIESVTAQTYPGLEIILADDGSTDQSGEICDSYARGDSRIKVLHKENGGLSDARNAGLSCARGEYVGFVDGDDYIEPYMYAKMLDACNEHDAQIAICRYNQIGGDPDWSEPDGETVPMDRETALRVYICGHPQYVIYNSVWSKLFRADVISGMTFGKRRAEDIMFTTESFCRADRFVYLDVPCYNYICSRSDSIMNEKDSRLYVDEIIPNYREQVRYLKEHGYTVFAAEAAYQMYRKMLFYYVAFAAGGRRRSARETAALMEADREQIFAVFHRDGVKTGDRVRMDTFLFCPPLYYGLSRAYSRMIVPVRHWTAGLHGRRRNTE